MQGKKVKVKGLCGVRAVDSSYVIFRMWVRILAWSDATLVFLRYFNIIIASLHLGVQMGTGKSWVVTKGVEVFSVV